MGLELRRASLQGCSGSGTGRDHHPAHLPTGKGTASPGGLQRPGITATGPTICRLVLHSCCPFSLLSGCLLACQATLPNEAQVAGFPSSSVQPACLPSPRDGHAHPSPSLWPALPVPWCWGPACPRCGHYRKEDAGSDRPGPQPGYQPNGVSVRMRVLWPCHSRPGRQFCSLGRDLHGPCSGHPSHPSCPHRPSFCSP